MNFRNLQARAAVAVMTALPLIASAQTEPATTYDASTNVAAITATIAGLLAVGGAAFLVHLAIRSTKWARRAL